MTLIAKASEHLNLKVADSWDFHQSFHDDFTNKKYI